MKKIKVWLAFLAFFILIAFGFVILSNFKKGPLPSASTTKIKFSFGQKIAVGQESSLFSSIDSVVEDKELNFYVLDGKEHQVFKFSTEGKLIKSFGDQGQGPGEFLNPYHLAYTPQDQIMVVDELYNLSFFTPQGSFINRLHLSGKLSLDYIGEDRFYAWIWREKDQIQVIVDRDNNVIQTFFNLPKTSFSLKAPDSSGRMVLFNFSRFPFVPKFVFTHFDHLSAIGIGNIYKIYLLDKNGQTIRQVQRDIKPQKFTSKEKKFLEQEIRDLAAYRHWPPKIAHDLIQKIPEEKPFFDQIFLTAEYLFVFRLKKDLADSNENLPVDIFTIEGKFLGETTSPGKPIYVSNHNFYFVRTDQEGNPFLEKYGYCLNF